MIDDDGYRLNVGIVILNLASQVFWARRYRNHSWQFPQGGIQVGENIEQAMYRELFEEVGLRNHDVRILAVTRNWLRYKLPPRFIRRGIYPVCIGQKQKWFLLQILCPDEDINIRCWTVPEFDSWKWVGFWYPVRKVISFKQEVYFRVMKEFSRIVKPLY